MKESLKTVVLEINGFTVIRDLSKKQVWEIHVDGKRIRSFSSFLHVSKFLFK